MGKQLHVLFEIPSEISLQWSCELVCDDDNDYCLMCVIIACMCVYPPHLCLVLGGRPEKGTSYELEQNPGPLQQQALLTTEPSLQSMN